MRDGVGHWWKDREPPKGYVSVKVERAKTAGAFPYFGFGGQLFFAGGHDLVVRSANQRNYPNESCPNHVTLGARPVWGG